MKKEGIIIIMTKKIEQYLLNTEHEPIIDIIYERAMLPKNRPEKNDDFQFINLMKFIGDQIIQWDLRYKDTYNPEYVNQFFNQMKHDFIE